MFMKEVQFFWLGAVRIFTVSGNSIEEITDKCHELCDKYHAIHFEILL